MDLILYNGQIHTMNDDKLVCEAIAIQGNKVASTGTNSEILALKTQHTQVIDLKNRLVFPGFHDSHMHLLGYGMALSQVDLSPAKSMDELIEITRSFISKNHIKPGTWVLGRGWNQDLYPSKQMPDKNDLDKISTEHPIVLNRVCGHVAVTNEKALSTLGLSSNYTEVDGGCYENGIFKENALNLIIAQIPFPTKETLTSYIKTGIKALHRFGITSVQSDDLCVFPKAMSQTILDTFEEMSTQNTLNIGVYEQSLFRDLEHFKTFIKKGYTLNKTIGSFKYGPLKILGDGALGGRTAWLKEGYKDADTFGISMYAQDDLNNYVEMAQKENISVAIHCIGDAMLDSALEAIIAAQKKYPQHKLRHGIVHCQITRPEQLRLMSEHHILAYVQPIFLDYDLNILEERVGKSLAETSYAWQTMTNLSIPIPFGSDAPVETPNPIKSIFCAVNRQTLKGWPENGFVKEEKIDLYEAFKHYTRTPAYASYDEKIKGQLIENYLADIVVLNQTHLDDLLDTKVDYTIYNGTVVYEAHKGN